MIKVPNKKVIWKHLAAGDDVNDIVKEITGEIFKQVNSIVSQLKKEYLRIEREQQECFKEVQTTLNTYSLHTQTEATRKDWALEFEHYQQPAILFNMLDDKDYSSLIWELLKPNTEEL